MAEGATDLFQSERGVWCIAVLVCATVLAVLRIIDAQAWMDFAKSLTYVIVGSKTVTTAVETIALKKPQKSTSPAPPAPADLPTATVRL